MRTKKKMVVNISIEFLSFRYFLNKNRWKSALLTQYHPHHSDTSKPSQIFQKIVSKSYSMSTRLTSLLALSISSKQLHTKSNAANGTNSYQYEVYASTSPEQLQWLKCADKPLNLWKLKAFNSTEWAPNNDKSDECALSLGVLFSMLQRNMWWHNLKLETTWIAASSNSAAASDLCHRFVH